MNRLPLALAAALSCLLLMSGCTQTTEGKGRDRQVLDGLQTEARQAVAAVVSDIASRLHLAFKGGNREFGQCSESYAPAVDHRVVLTFEDRSGLVAPQEVVAQLLAKDGWQVKAYPGSTVVEGRKGHTKLRFSNLLQVEIELTSTCTDVGKSAFDDDRYGNDSAHRIDWARRW